MYIIVYTQLLLYAHSFFLFLERQLLTCPRAHLPTVLKFYIVFSSKSDKALPLPLSRHCKLFFVACLLSTISQAFSLYTESFTRKFYLQAALRFGNCGRVNCRARWSVLAVFVHSSACHRDDLYKAVYTIAFFETVYVLTVCIQKCFSFLRVSLTLFCRCKRVKSFAAWIAGSQDLAILPAALLVCIVMDKWNMNRNMQNQKVLFVGVE